MSRRISTRRRSGELHNHTFAVTSASCSLGTHTMQLAARPMRFGSHRVQLKLWVLENSEQVIRVSQTTRSPDLCRCKFCRLKGVQCTSPLLLQVLSASRMISMITSRTSVMLMRYTATIS
eukprot:6469556-Amphidinium_carterae.1